MSRRVKIRFDRVSKVFYADSTDTVAVQDVGLDVLDGEFMCVLGPSGCGKTTLLNILAGLLGPTGGRIFINDRAVEGPGDDRAYVFQEYALFPWMTVLDNVAFGLESRGASRQSRHGIARRILQTMGLSEFMRVYPHAISGGMKQRVSIARALAVNPEIILMDEPFAALDAQTRFNLQQELLSIWEVLKKTVVFVTHNIEEAMLLADRIAIMTARPGRIKQVVDVGLPRPRDVTSLNYLSVLKEVQRLLSEEIEAAHQDYQGLVSILESSGKDHGR